MRKMGIYYEENVFLIAFTMNLLWGKCFPHSIYYEENIFLIVKFSKEIFLIFQWFIQRIKNLNFKKIFSHTKWVKTLVKIFKNGFFQKSSKFFGKCSESSDSFRKLKVSIYFFQYKMGHNTYKFQKLNFQEIPGNRGIHNSGYWKIAGLTACYFQGNSWKLGASIIRVIGK